MTPWPHQTRAVQEVLAARDAGKRRVLLSMPTGSGKTFVADQLIQMELAAGRKACIYTNRKLLLEQTARVFGDVGYGVRASGHANEYYKPFQICSIQTESRRINTRENYELHKADLVIIDEAHLNSADSMQDIAARHIEHGAMILGLTATPIDLGHFYDDMIVAANNSELRECGALVKAIHYGIEEPDCRKLKVPVGEDISENVLRKLMGAPKIVGRVIENYRRLNPEQKPTILFASGVSESLFFAEQFTRAGHRWAHIDGDWIGLGEMGDDEKMILYPANTTDLRKDLGEMVREGVIKGVSNRFVLREGIDWPFLVHGIFATVFGSLQTFLQSGGRLLRAYPGKTEAIIQCHGGSWWRHGSLNADREWRLEWSGTMIAAMREDRLRDGIEPEPFRCPDCAMILAARCCPCGFTIDTRRRSRPVMQLDGEIVMLEGAIHQPRRIYTRPDGPKQWERIVLHRHRTKNVDGKFRERTFRECFNVFSRDNYGQYPDRSWPLMPRRDLDIYRCVADVPKGELN